VGVDSGVLKELRANVFELGFLLKARDGDPVALVGRLAVFKRDILELPAQQHDTLKFPLLLRGGFELVLEGLADGLLFHMSLFCLIDANVARAKAAREARLTACAKAQRLAAG
jgi:hypothetical protein